MLRLLKFFRRKKLLREYVDEFQKRIDTGHQLACGNQITDKCFIDYRKDVCELLAGFRKTFGDETFAAFYIIHSLDTLTLSGDGVKAMNTSHEDRKQQLIRYISNLESIVNSIVRDLQLEDSKLQNHISLFAVLVAIIVPCILNCCSHTIDEEQFNTLINSIQSRNSNHITQQDSISLHPRK